MTTTELIENIFSIFHDGSITAWTGDHSLLTLTIECAYLAERVDKSYDRFYVELHDVDKLELDVWTNDVKTSDIRTEFAHIFEAELDISSADIKGNTVMVSCLQLDDGVDYTGGNLTIGCRDIKVLKQNKNELTIFQLREISQGYWDQWRRKGNK